MLKEYVKKPTIIHAVQLTQGNHDAVAYLIADSGYNVRYWSKPPMRAVTGLIIESSEGNMEAGYGDWIIKEVDGSFYVCNDDVFHFYHEEVN